MMDTAMTVPCIGIMLGVPIGSACLEGGAQFLPSRVKRQLVSHHRGARYRGTIRAEMPQTSDASVNSVCGITSARTLEAQLFSASTQADRGSSFPMMEVEPQIPPTSGELEVVSEPQDLSRTKLPDAVDVSEMDTDALEESEGATGSTTNSLGGTRHADALAVHAVERGPRR